MELPVEQHLGYMASLIKSNMKAVVALLILVGLSACSSTTREPEIFNYANYQLPPPLPYSDTAWTQPPVVIPGNLAGTSFEESQAPMLRSQARPAARLPNAESRRY